MTKRILYLGLKAPSSKEGVTYIHYPVIKIAPASFDDPTVEKAFRAMESYSHLLFTSKTAVDLFFTFASHYNIAHPAEGKAVVAVGWPTAATLQRHGVEKPLVADDPCAEGVAELFKTLAAPTLLFWPHSALSRDFLARFFAHEKIAFKELALYTTVPQKPGPLPQLDAFDEIFFTSPSTVDSFFSLCTPPKGIALKAIGPITQAKLDQLSF